MTPAAHNSAALPRERGQKGNLWLHHSIAGTMNAPVLGGHRQIGSICGRVSGSAFRKNPSIISIREWRINWQERNAHLLENERNRFLPIKLAHSRNDMRSMVEGNPISVELCWLTGTGIVLEWEELSFH